MRKYEIEIQEIRNKIKELRQAIDQRYLFLRVSNGITRNGRDLTEYDVEKISDLYFNDHTIRVLSNEIDRLKEDEYVLLTKYKPKKINIKIYLTKELLSIIEDERTRQNTSRNTYIVSLIKNDLVKKGYLNE